MKCKIQIFIKWIVCFYLIISTSKNIFSFFYAIPDWQEDFEGGFISVGCPIIYVFEVREDLRKKGIGYLCAQTLIHNVIEGDTIQLCCSPFVRPFWQKVGFEIVYFDQSLYMNKMVLKKGGIKEEDEIEGFSSP